MILPNEKAIIREQAPARRNGIRVKTVALPAEHGGWGLVLEPVVLGLLLAPSVIGVYLALSAVALFLSRQPLTIVVLNRGRVSPRTVLAKQFAVLYLFIAAASFTAALAFSQNSFLLPLLLAAPLGIVQIAHDWTGRRRVLLAELAGAVAISSLATAITLAGGWSKPEAFALWALMIARALPAILYIRTLLLRLHGKTAAALSSLLAHVVGVVIVVWLATYSLVPRLAALMMIVLLARAALGFSLARQRGLTAKQIGFSEIAFGAAAVCVIALGQAIGF